MSLKCYREKLTEAIIISCSTVLFCIMAALFPDIYAVSKLSLLTIFVAVLVLLLSFRGITGGILYFLCLILMHCGQIFMLAVGMEFPAILTTSIALGDKYPHSLEAVRFTTVACMIVALILVLAGKREQADEKQIADTDEELSISWIGWCMVAGVAILAVISDIVRAWQVAEVGYAEGFQQHNVILFYADMLFPLFCYLVIAAYKNKAKAVLAVLMVILARAAFSIFFIGSRGQAVLDIIMGYYATTVLTSDRKIKRFANILFYSIAGAGVLVLPLAGLLRGDALTTEAFFDAYKPIEYSLTEFGGSVVNVRLAIPTHGDIPVSEFFLHFLALVPASTHLFPFLTDSYGGNYALYLNTAGGDRLGGSVFGEAAFWFGNSVGGWLYVAVIAVVLILCINALSKGSSGKTIIRNTVLLYLISCIFFQVRGTVSDLLAGVKIAIYFWIIFFFLEKYLFKRVDPS